MKNILTMSMMRKTATILLIAIGFSSCNSKRPHPQDSKVVLIRHVIKKSGWIRLPLSFDAYNHPLQTNYTIDKKSNDSLIFDSDIDGIVGFLPDTTNCYAFLCHTTGDMEYPTIMTVNKKGNRIDRQIICTAGCAGHASLEVSSCYDSVWIDTDLRIKSVSKITGTVETEEPQPQVLSICNMRELHGFIDKNGKISIEESDVMDCNTTDHKGKMDTPADTNLRWMYKALGDSLFERHRNEKHFSYKRQIANGIYEMEIETFCCNDTIKDIDPPLVASPIITEQRLIFKKDNVVQKQCKLPIKTIYYTNNHGKKVKGVEVDIYSVYVLKGSNGDIFGISGTGMCLTAGYPEFAAFYTMDGNILSHCHYRAKYDLDNGFMYYHEGTCLEDKVFEKYGIMYDDYNSEVGQGGVRVDVFKPIPTDD